VKHVIEQSEQRSPTYTYKYTGANSGRPLT